HPGVTASVPGPGQVEVGQKSRPLQFGEGDCTGEVYRYATSSGSSSPSSRRSIGSEALPNEGNWGCGAGTLLAPGPTPCEGTRTAFTLPPTTGAESVRPVG